MAPAPPSQWPIRQREFREAVERGAGGLPATPVHWRGVGAVVYRPSFLRGIDTVLWAALRLARRRQLNAQPFVALWPIDAPPGAAAVLIFDVAEMPAEPEGDGVAVGELAMNGALCLVLADGTRVWPTYNPRVPAMYPERR